MAPGASSAEYRQSTANDSFAELYIDRNKKSYRDLGFRRYNLLNVWGSVLNSSGRAAISKVRATADSL